MAGIRITQFSGISPRISRRLLPDTSAQVAANCRLTNGELVPTYASKLVYTTGKAGDQLAVYRASDSTGYAWLTWPKDVDVVRSPLPGAAKWVYTGDGEPRVTTLAMATSGGGTSYPNTYYALGIPQPHTAPTVSASGGTGSTVSRVYVYTYMSQWGEESAPSQANVLYSGKVDGTWTISGMDAFPSNSGTVTGSYGSGVTTFTDTVDTWLRAGDEVVIAAATMVVASAPTTKTFTVTGDYHTATTWARKAPWNTTSMKRRLYRSAGTNATYQLVNDNVGTSYSDTLTDAQIMGDELISTDWQPPPTGLKGIFALPSGSLCGFYGNTLYFCEPYQPHAWVASYELRTNYDIVAAGSFGSGIGVATTAAPFIITGGDPGAMSGVDWPEVLPCAAKRSIVSTGDMVLYSSPLGMVSIGPSGAAIWSLGFFTNVEWEAFNPSTMYAAYANRHLYVHYTDDYGNQSAFVFNLLGDSTALTTTNFIATELYSDGVTGKLYIVNGQDISEYDNNEQYAAVLDWMSKEFVLPKPINLGAAKIDFDGVYDQSQIDLILAEIATITAANAAMLVSGNVHGAWNARRYNKVRYAGSELTQPPAVPAGNQVSFSLYVDGVLKFAKTVTNNAAFRLPSGYKADRFAVRVTSQNPIQAILVGPTPKSLESA